MTEKPVDRVRAAAAALRPSPPARIHLDPAAAEALADWFDTCAEYLDRWCGHPPNGSPFQTKGVTAAEAILAVAGQPAPAVQVATAGPEEAFAFARDLQRRVNEGDMGDLLRPAEGGDLRQQIADTLEEAHYNWAGPRDPQPLCDAQADAVLPVVRAAETAARVAVLTEADRPTASTITDDQLDALRVRVAELEQGISTQNGLLEETRDALEDAGFPDAHIDDWPQTAPGVRLVLAELVAARAEIAQLHDDITHRDATIRNLEGGLAAERAALARVRAVANGLSLHRSEERRVGKECRSRWSPYH